MAEMDEPCRKCGGTNVGLKWYGVIYFGSNVLPEFIKATCLRCGYSWSCAPRDVPVPPRQEG